VAASGLAPGEELGAARERELREAGRLLGLDAVECLRHPDGELEWADPEAVAGDLAGRVAALRPRALVTFGETGLYHHPDHVAVHRLVLAALSRLSVPPALYQAAWPRGLVPGIVTRMRERGLEADLWGLAPEDFGETAEDRLVAIDVVPFLETKLAALRCHRTQLSPQHLLNTLPDDLAREILGREHFLPPPSGRGRWLEQVVGRAGRGARDG
jgi:N-acetyl-1-D-myo-inositol-2-amino-2-deoxy-alpha-D-glucopyranoside deacetylase